MKLGDAFARSLALLDGTERHLLIVLGFIVLLSAAASAAVVASVFPFLTFVSDPTALETKPWLTTIYVFFGFTSRDAFLIALGIGAIVVTVLSSTVQILKVYCVAFFTARQRYILSRRLFDHYVGQSYEYFLTRHSGDITAKIISESDVIVNQVFRPSVEMISSSISIIAIIGVLIAVNPLIALAALLALGGAYGATLVFRSKKLRHLGLVRADMNSVRHRVVGETFGSIKAVKLHDLENYSSALFERPSKRIVEADASMQVLSEFPRSVVQAIALTSVIVICLVLLSGKENSTAIGEIVPLLGVFGLAGMRLMPEFQGLYSSLAKLQYSFSAIDRIHNDLIEVAERNSLGPHAPVKPIGLRESFELRNVTFRYRNADTSGIANVSLSFRAGERIGIVGATGTGKTTLADVTLGLLVPERGEMFVDGKEITEDLRSAWRKSIGYVPQEFTLRDASVAENIAFGVLPGNIDHIRVRQVAEVAQIADFVDSTMRHGFETLVGERGVQLSGGQRQRIAIARALYQDVSLIGFDEATSALDNLTEREIMNAIEALPGDKTLVLIAHRLSSVRNCDRIYLMQSSEIVASGNWETLFSENAAFRKLAQSGAPT